jgi:Protein of unknown function (DUF3568)
MEPMEVASMPHRRIPTLLPSAAILAALTFAQTGCLLVAAAAGTGATVAYVTGDLESMVDAPPDKVAAAAQAALRDMNLAVVSARGSALDADVVARTANDAKVHVVAKSRGEKMSWVSIRIGVFGNDAMSAQILEKIKQHLADPAPPHDVAATNVNPDDE